MQPVFVVPIKILLLLKRPLARLKEAQKTSW
jgi:hypothetical protein